MLMKLLEHRDPTGLRKEDEEAGEHLERAEVQGLAVFFFFFFLTYYAFII